MSGTEYVTPQAVPPAVAVPSGGPPTTSAATAPEGAAAPERAAAGRPGEDPLAAAGGPAGPVPPGPPPEPPVPAATPEDRRLAPLPRLRALGPRSLTGRLTIGVVALVVVIVGLVGAGTTYSLKAFLYDRLDQQLTTASQVQASFFGTCFAEGSPVCHLGNAVPSAQIEYVALLTTRGRVVPVGSLNSETIAPLTLDAATAAAIAADPTRIRTVRVGDIEVRVQGRVFPNDVIVVTGLSTAELRRTLGRLVALELLIGGGAVVLALLATLYGVRFGLRGLRRVSATAQEVAVELGPSGAGLDRRVPGEDDSTEIGQLAQSMNTLLSAVETQFRARIESEARLRQFLADASHELRTPLTSIRGYAELARMQRAAGSGADAEDNLERIEHEGTRMSRLVEDLLTLARSDRAEQVAPAHELVDVADLVDDVAAGARAAHPDRPIEAFAASGVQLVGDPDQLLRVIRNLVTNAAVHTAPGRPIRIDARAEGPDVVIRVADGGPGLPAEEAAHVFERFWRADKARTRARGGSGLGLSIVATIVAAHGGTVRFDSAVETGSTVTVRLPRAES